MGVRGGRAGLFGLEVMHAYCGKGGGLCPRAAICAMPFSRLFRHASWAGRVYGRQSRAPIGGHLQDGACGPMGAGRVRSLMLQRVPDGVVPRSRGWRARMALVHATRPVAHPGVTASHRLHPVRGYRLGQAARRTPPHRLGWPPMSLVVLGAADHPISLRRAGPRCGLVGRHMAGARAAGLLKT
jgi:hypothetical protein